MLTAAAYGMPPLGALVEFSAVEENPSATTKEELAKAFQGIFSLPTASDLVPTFVDNLPFFMSFESHEEAVRCLCPTPPEGKESSPLRVKVHLGRYYAWDGSPSGYKKQASFLYRVDPNHKLTSTQVKFLMHVFPADLSFSQVFTAVKGGRLFKADNFLLREAGRIELPLQVSLSFSEEPL